MSGRAKTAALEHIASVVAVLSVNAILTVAIFDPPPEAPPPDGTPRAEAASRVGGEPRGAATEPPEWSGSPPGVAGSRALEASPDGTPTVPSREAAGAPSPMMNATLARALRALSQPAGDEALSQAPGLLATMRQLQAAVRTARDARDEKDLARAEEMLREARREMDRSCGGSQSALCDSAKTLRELGY